MSISGSLENYKMTIPNYEVEFIPFERRHIERRVNPQAVLEDRREVDRRVNRAGSKNH